ncbi:hypothetical protein EYZ11_013115 [Aspergillus tanneri]|nr:hypothetical protein EYZ11_013115 [Aspergillus tanneri]
MSLRLDLCLIESMDTIRANFAHRFVELLEQVELVTSGFRDERCSSSPRRPSLFMETGVIVPLFYICEESGDPELSRRAMEVLESWPHREGLWDSNVAATMIRSMGALNGNGNGFYTAIPLYT